jgi:hypothetical protein
VNFSGWVQLRRGILNHLHEGKLSNIEFLVLVVLIMLADKETGAGTINAPCLRSFVPHLSYDAAKRVLLSLEEKHYIYRKIKYKSDLPYPFWVNRYIPSAGPHKGLQIDLAKVSKSKDFKDITYINHAPEDAPQGASEGAPDPALHYKTREEKHKKGNKALINRVKSASVSASLDDTTPPIVITQAQHTVSGASALHSALLSDDGIRRMPTTVTKIKADMPDMATVIKRGMEDRFLAFEAGLRLTGGGRFEDLEKPHCPEVGCEEAYSRLLPHLSNSSQEINA